MKTKEREGRDGHKSWQVQHLEKWKSRGKDSELQGTRGYCSVWTTRTKAWWAKNTQCALSFSKHFLDKTNLIDLSSLASCSPNEIRPCITWLPWIRVGVKGDESGRRYGQSLQYL